MTRKIALTLCCSVLLLLGLWQLYGLQTQIRTDSIVEAVEPFHKTYLARVRYQSTDGVVRTAKINANGRQVGEVLPVMYQADRPEQTLTAYSPWLYLIPAVCCPGALAIIWLIWSWRGPLPAAKRS